jgi:enolase
MKRLITGALFMITTAAVAVAEPTYEIVYTKFKFEISIEKQKELMAALNQVVQTFDGFESRNYFYSDELGAWVDIVTWTNSQAALAANKLAMENAEALKVFAYMDETNMIFSHYQQIGSITK